MTYKEVAEAAGNPRAARAAGTVMKTNHDPKPAIACCGVTERRADIIVAQSASGTCCGRREARLCNKNYI